MVEKHPCGPRARDCLALRHRNARSPTPAFGRKAESRAVAAPGPSCADRRGSALISEPPRGFGDPHGGRPGIPGPGDGAGHHGSRTGDSRPTGRCPGHLRGATAVAAAASTGPGLASLEATGVLDTFHHPRRAKGSENEELDEDRAAPLVQRQAPSPVCSRRFMVRRASTRSARCGTRCPALGCGPSALDPAR